MSIFQFRSTDRGPEYRAPTMRVEHARIISGGIDSTDRPDWLGADMGRFWQPLRLSWAGNGKLSTLTLKSRPAIGDATGVAHRSEGIDLADGDLVRLVQLSSAGQIEWFRGYVARRSILIESDNENVEVTAFGPEIRLKGAAISGQWHKKPTVDDSEIAGTLQVSQTLRENVFASDLAVVFNKGGRPNASASNWRLAGGDGDRACKVFEPIDRRVIVDGQATVQAQYWTALTALRSLVEYVDNYSIISPRTHWGRIGDLLGDAPIGEVDVSGLSLLEAFGAVLKPAGFGFAVEPWTASFGAGNTPRHRLRVFNLRDGGPVKAPRLASMWGDNVSVDSAEGRAAEIQRLEFHRDARKVANDITVIGAQKRVQLVLDFNNTSTCDLHPLWDTQTHDLANWATGNVVDPWQWDDDGNYTFADFAERYNRGGKDHWRYDHVFRSFAWNEDGAFGSLISTRPDLSDLGIADNGCYIRRPRPFASTYVYDSDGQKIRTHPRKVQLGIVGDDDSWIDIPARIWNDRAGFTISAGLLAGSIGDGQWYPYASHAQHSSTYRDVHYLTLLHNALRNAGEHKLRLRLIGSVECDQAAKAVASRPRRSAWPFRCEKVLRLGGRFRWQEVIDDPFEDTLQHAEIDDRDQAELYAQSVRDALETPMGRGSITLRYLTRSYAPGDSVAKTAGRVVNLYLDEAARKSPVVDAVVWDFDDGANKTELILDRPGRMVSK